MLTKNRFKGQTDAQAAPSSVEIPPEVEENLGCVKCEKGCTLCDNFLVETKTFTTPKTEQIFKIKSRISCDTKAIIYLINDRICKDVFYVGYSMNDMKERWRNHKSHIKTGKKTCEIASHFRSLSKSAHKLDTTDQKRFTSQLAEHLEVTLIESVTTVPKGYTLKKYLEEREDFWKGTLKADRLFGGINKR